MDARDVILFAMAALVAALGLWWTRVVAAALVGSMARFVGRGEPGEHPARALLSADWIAVTIIVPLAAWPLWPAGDERAVLAPTAGRLAGPDAYAREVVTVDDTTTTPAGSLAPDEVAESSDLRWREASAEHPGAEPRAWARTARGTIVGREPGRR